jgi:hypothetical protein
VPVLADSIEDLEAQAAPHPRPSGEAATVRDLDRNAVDVAADRQLYHVVGRKSGV